ncbi:MAG: DUF1684 domain-containing protein [Melioribacteraceae bacterium]
MKYIIIALSLLLITSCGKKYTDEEINYIKSIEEQRKIKNEFMKNDPTSPFNYKGKVEFHKLNYFDVDPKFVFKSKLYEYNPKDTITIYGTKGEPRKAVRFGYVIINYENKEYKVNVYEGTTKSGEKYYSIWFTDKTTNKESYGVGRYLDFEKHDNPDYIYTIDFNLAYNPYCAYSPNYSCAIPTKEDFIPIEIKAGEKKFHN